MPAADPSSEVSGLRILPAIVELLFHLLVIFVCVGSLPPGVNESHYLPKAKHAWDPEFASGGDIFLQSGDAHLLATTTAGLLARWFELSEVAWIGRLTSWLFLALAWMRLCHALQLPRLLRPAALLVWILGVHYGNWAGEWFVGGFEAKAVAYPCVLWGLANVVENRWNRVWIWLGAAVAWHPVVGGWAGISVAILGLVRFRGTRAWRAHLPGMMIGAVIGLVGVVPALSSLTGADHQGAVSASQVHAFLRLSHHMLPRAFAPERHWWAVMWLALLVASTVLVVNSWRRWGTRPVTQLLWIAWAAVGLSLVGLAIDGGMRWGLSEPLAARLLRLYWFRWVDVAVPLALVVGWARWLGDLSFQAGGLHYQQVTARGSRYLSAVLIIVGGVGFLHWRRLMSAPVPPADQLMLKSVGPVPVHWDWPETAVGPAEADDAQPIDGRFDRRYIDWLAVCDWIRQNTPADSLWLTPKYQQTFKWYAGRAEVVSWKDVPQDNTSIIEWYQRLQQCNPPRGSDGAVRGWTTEELLELAKRYRFQWVLVDRTYQAEPPLLECKYPILIDNRSFAVFYLAPSLLDSSAP